jgi:hypothetical protein
MRCLVALPAALLMLGCAQEPGRTFDVPIERARTILLQSDLPPQVFGTVAPQHNIHSEGPDRIVWSVLGNTGEMLRFNADLKAVDADSTRISVGISPPAYDPKGVGERLKQNPSIAKMYMVAMEEEVASSIEGRAFDMSKVYPAMMAAAAANIGTINNNFDQAAEEYHRRDRENIERAYEQEAHGQ